MELIRFLHGLIDNYLQSGWSLSLNWWSADVWLTANIEIFGSHDFKFDLLLDTCSVSDEGFQQSETDDDDETSIECAISILLSVSMRHVRHGHITDILNYQHAGLEGDKFRR